MYFLSYTQSLASFLKGPWCPETHEPKERTWRDFEVGSKPEKVPDGIVLVFTTAFIVDTDAGIVKDVMFVFLHVTLSASKLGIGNIARPCVCTGVENNSSLFICS